jgi:dolichol phosphate-mannose biosynthesis regulatory protein
VDTSHGDSYHTRYIQAANSSQPFVDPDQPIQNLFPPRVWAIRIPVILILLGSAVVGSFLGVVMIRSNRKRAAKAKAAGKKKA